MNVLVITERGEDFAVAAILIPQGRTEEEVFLAWVRDGCRGGHSGYDPNRSDEEILRDNTEYVYISLRVRNEVNELIGFSK